MQKDKEVWVKLYKFEIEDYKKQYREPFRSTVSAMDVLEKHAGFGQDSHFRVLDIGTGGGANVYWMAKRFPMSEFVGIDLSPDLINLSKILSKDIPNAEFHNLDFKSLEKLGNFDFVISFQLLSWLSLENATDAFRIHCEKAQKGVFVTSLFEEGNLDYEIKVLDHYTKRESHYNIYSIPRYRKIANQFGFRLQHFVKFNIDLDLPKLRRGLGTYTVKTMNGDRMQFSGSMYLPWYFILFIKEY